jgi:uncharacterized membrane protein YbaN (DUF454 family)
LNTSKQRFRRGVGLFFFALGTLGIGVPLLPTVPFWILAAIFFARSDPALQRKIYAHPQFGLTVRQFVENRVLSRRAKCFSIGGAGIGTGVGLWLTNPPAYVIATVSLIMVGVFVWLATRPESIVGESDR